MEKVITIGRRKRSVARVFLTPAGKGNISVNKSEFEKYFVTDLQRLCVFEPFRVLEASHNDYDMQINVVGGGTTGQAEAVRLGIARALVETNPEFRPPLKAAGLLTRDSRKVERKKYGKRKARKSTQFSKR